MSRAKLKAIAWHPEGHETVVLFYGSFYLHVMVMNGSAQRFENRAPMSAYRNAGWIVTEIKQ